MAKQTGIQNLDQLEFAVFCIENIAVRHGVNAKLVYQALEDSDILMGYIVSEYDMLHTQSKDYIVNDILAVMKARGVKL